MQTDKPGPDFICIGMPSSGTRWLYDNLQAHDDVHMPLIKELHFLDRGLREQTVRNRVRQFEQMRAEGKPIDPSDEAFLARYARCDVISELREAEQAFSRDFKNGDRADTPFLPEDRHFAFYSSLFECYQPKKTGDITPGYWRLRPETIAACHKKYPNVKYLAVIRNPVRRAVSSINKKIHKGTLQLDLAKRMIAEPARFFGAFQDTKAPKLLPTQVVSKWSKTVGRDAILVVTLDDIASRPDAARREIYEFLGLSNDPSKVDLNQTGNRKENVFQNLLSDVDTAKLREVFAEEIERSQAMFGGATLNW